MIWDGLDDANLGIVNYNPFLTEPCKPDDMLHPPTLVSPENNSTVDTKGNAIKTLRLSKRSAGVYVSKDRAAYWDGKDDAGEQVASGVYFYTLQAGNFSASRKMVIMR